MAFIGGLLGAVFMDLVESYLSRFGINSGVKATHIGKWVRGLFQGQVYHSNIDTSAASTHDLPIAVSFHYVIGGGVVALGYPAFMLLFSTAEPVWHIPFSLLFGLMTCVLPWFILMPAIGKGSFGRNMPLDARPVLAPILSHLGYGLGIGLTLLCYDIFTH